MSLNDDRENLVFTFNYLELHGSTFSFTLARMLVNKNLATDLVVPPDNVFCVLQ